VIYNYANRSMSDQVQFIPFVFLPIAHCQLKTAN